MAETLFLENRVEHQKRNQTTTELPFGWVFGVQLGLRQTQALITTNRKTIIQQLDDGEVISSTNLYVRVPKTVVNNKKVKNKAPLLLFGFVFGVKLKYLGLRNAAESVDL